MRGVYEEPIDSGIWWIHYYAAGKRHREKVGRKSDAIKLYQSRKADAVAGRKLPELRNSKVVTLAELIDITMSARYSHLSPATNFRWSNGSRERPPNSHQPPRSENAKNKQPPKQPPTENAQLDESGILMISLLLFWCREGGSNPHEVALGGF